MNNKHSVECMMNEKGVGSKLEEQELSRANLECLDIFKTQPGPVAKNAISDHPAGNRTCDLANLVRYSANWATKAVAKNMATSSVCIMVVMPIKRRLYSMDTLWKPSILLKKVKSHVSRPLSSSLLFNQGWTEYFAKGKLREPKTNKQLSRRR